MLNCEEIFYLEDCKSIIRVHANIFRIRKQPEYDDLIKYVIGVISQANASFDMYVNLDKIKPQHLDFDFIKDFITLLQNLFPNKLNKCYVLNCSVLCKILYDNLKFFIDKKNHSKIEFVAIMQKPTVVTPSNY